MFNNVMQTADEIMTVLKEKGTGIHFVKLLRQITASELIARQALVVLRRNKMIRRDGEMVYLYEEDNVHSPKQVPGFGVGRTGCRILRGPKARGFE